jgi:hypothetical protein
MTETSPVPETALLKIMNAVDIVQNDGKWLLIACVYKLFFKADHFSSFRNKSLQYNKPPAVYAKYFYVISELGFDLLNFRNQDYKFGGFRRRFKRETV